MTSQQPEWLDADVLARLAAVERDDVDGEAAERARADHARTTLAARWTAASGRTVTVTLAGGHVVRGVVADAGTDWVWLAQGPGEAVVRQGAVLTVTGLRPVGGEDPSTRSDGPGPGHPLRRLLTAQRPVRLLLVGGTSVPASLVRVGRDALDAVGHPADRPPAPDDPWLTVPWAAVAAVLAG